MAETGRLTAPAAPLFGPVTLVRLAIIAAVLVIWEVVAASGLLFRDVVPSLTVIAQALVALLADPTYYWNLGVTAGEIGIALLIGGVVVTESVYAIPGLGRLTVDAVLARDFPTIQGVILLFSFAYVLINLLVDVSYVFLDPRIRY